MTIDQETLKQIRSAPLFSKLSDDKVKCLEQGEVLDIAPGTVLVADGARYPFFFVVLDGEVRIVREYDNQEVLMAVVKPGNYTGELTIMLNVPWMSTARVAKPTRIFQFTQEHFWKMVAACPDIAQEVFRSGANKMRNLEGFSQQREKLASLGTMAAGLAHELNNPASAARRASQHIAEVTDKLQSFLCVLSKKLDHGQWELLLSASAASWGKMSAPPKLDNLDRSDREDALANWMSARKVEPAWDLAPTFVGAGIDGAWLEQALAKLPGDAQAPAVCWLEARLNLRMLLQQIDQSTARIAELVKAVKSYSYMDQSPVQDVDIHEGIESTLTMLGHKLKSVEVVRAFDRSIPRIVAYGSALNQVWTNLIDNAIDAVKGKGKICIGTYEEDGRVIVEIVDNGEGIPPEVQAHLFEPFYTTKPIGSGTGLGLIICNRIVADRHGGEIEVESKPGETRFRVRLPIKRKT